MSKYRIFMFVAAMIVFSYSMKFMITQRNPDNFIDDVPINYGPSVTEVRSKAILNNIKSAKKVTYVNIWATWCDPCIKEIPDIVKLKDRFPANEFQVILISADSPKKKREVQQFLSTYGVTFPSYLMSPAEPDFLKKLNPNAPEALPLSLLFSKDGFLLDSWEGYTPLDKMAARISDSHRF